MSAVRAALVASLIFTSTGVALAQGTCTATGVPSSCTAGGPLSITVVYTVRVTITPTSASLGNPTANDFTQGYSEALGQTVAVNANSAWRLHISSASTNFSASGGARANKPRSDLQWATPQTGGGFSSVTGTGSQIAAGSATTTVTVPITYRVLWTWALDSPGTYTLPVTMTILAP